MSTILFAIVLILCLGGSSGGYYGQSVLIFIGIVFVAAFALVVWLVGSKSKTHDIC